MLIQCTKKMLDQIKQEPVVDAKEDPLFSWHANLLTVNRRKTIVLINDLNKYIIVLYGVKAKELKSLGDVIINAVRKSLMTESIKAEIIDQFLMEAGEVKFSKTSDRSLIGGLNMAGRYLSHFQDEIKEGVIYQPELSARLSKMIVRPPGGGKGYINPKEENLEQRWSKPIFEGKAVELRVTLDLDESKVWRRLVVPANISFSKFHEILQTAFNWQGHHLHEFYIFGEKKFDQKMYNHPAYHPDRYKPIMNLVCDEEAFQYADDNEPMKLASEAKLIDYIPTRMKYNYDFGDNWQHFIEVEKVIDQYDQNFALCLDGAGNSPPEDVGGSSGYEEFLRIIDDPSNPEYQFTVDWGKQQGYREFSIEWINWGLKEL